MTDMYDPVRLKTFTEMDKNVPEVDDSLIVEPVIGVVEALVDEVCVPLDQRNDFRSAATDS